MSYGALIAYRNKVWDSTISHFIFGDGEISGPPQILATPQLGEVWRAVPGETLEPRYLVEIYVEFAETTNVGVLGLLNMSQTLSSYRLFLLNAADTVLLDDTVATPVEYPAEDYLPANHWRVLDTPIAGVKKAVIWVYTTLTASTTPVEGTLTLGGLWIGPAWVLDTVDAGWTMDVGENAIVVESDGNQTRAMPARKFRTVSLRASSLTERQAYGIGDDATKVSAENSLLDLFMFSGKSRPIVAFPRLSSAPRQAAMGVYGYMTSALRIRAASGPQAGDEPTRHSSDTVTVRESL